MKHLYLLMLMITGFAEAQALSWTAIFGDVGDDICTDAAVDAAGNIYAVGIFKNSVDFNPGSGVFYINELSAEVGDAYCVKLNSSGQLVWAKAIGGASGYIALEETTPTITLDPSGNIYIAGIYQNNVDMDPGAGTLYLPVTETGLSTGNFLCKLSNNGTLQWCRRYGGSYGESFNRRMRADASGNIYLAGYFRATMYFQTAGGTSTLTADGQKYDGYVAKFDTDGNNVWAFSLGTAAKNDYIRDMDIDNNGHLAITGSYSGTVDFDPRADSALSQSSILDGDDSFIAKYDAITTECLWAKSFGRENSTTADAGYNVVLTPNGSVVGTGYFRVKADFNPAPGAENVYYLDAVGGASSLFMIRLSPEGTLDWAKTIGAVSETLVDMSEKSYAMDTDAAGNIYITGDYLVRMDADPGAAEYILGSNGGSYQTFYMKLSGSGNFEWARWMGPNTNRSATGRIILACPNNKVVVGGRFHGPLNFNQGEATPVVQNGNWPSYDSFLLSVDQAVLSTGTLNTPTTTVYPNPFSDKLEIAAGAEVLTATLYDTAGKIIHTQQNNAPLDTSRLAAGWYVLQVTTSAGTQSFKVAKR